MVWQVMVFEYVRHVFRKRFLLAVLSLPLFVGVMALVVMLLVRSEINLKPVGYVDQSGILVDPETLFSQGSQSGLVKIISFEGEDLAQEALQAGQIQAYYVINADYLETRQAKLVAIEEPSNAATAQFGQFVKVNLITDFPSEVVHRLTSGSQLVIKSVDGGRQFVQGDWVGFLLPFLVAFIFLVAVFATSGYLLQAVVEEKENRTMELLVSSISPRQLMTGKILGIIAVGWTQLFIWFGLGLILLLAASLFLNFTSWISISAGYLMLALVLFVPAFVMLSALMVAVGATLTDVQEAQQVTSIFTLPLFIPFWFVFQIINHPNGPVAVGLSLFPFTAPIALAIRAGFASIPTWQIALSLGLLITCAGLAVWLAGRAFRLGMVRYGQRLTWKEFFGFKGGGKAQA
jgi:ABC-2 type transport system permease protein